MKEICKISFDEVGSDCNDSVEPVSDISERIAFEFGSGANLKQSDLDLKLKIQNQLIQSASKCFSDGECDSLDILALRWKKCGACNKELPFLMKDVVEPLREAGVPVLYEELDAKSDPGGKEMFIKAGCQGTPCVLVIDPATGEYTKSYEGRQGTIARLSNILKIPNPLFYGEKTEYSKPLSMFNIRKDNIIENNRSMPKW